MIPIRNGAIVEPPQAVASTSTEPTSAAAALARIAHDLDGALTERDRVRARGDVQGRDRAVRPRVDARDRVADRSGHPEGAASERDSGGSLSDRDRGSNAVRPDRQSVG